jgi:hypothetical protein
MIVSNADWQAAVLLRLFLVPASKGRGASIEAVLIGTTALGEFFGVNDHTGE